MLWGGKASQSTRAYYRDGACLWIGEGPYIIAPMPEKEVWQAVAADQEGNAWHRLPLFHEEGGVDE